MRSSYSKVYNLAYRLAGNPNDAEDLTQEAYYRAFRRFETYDGTKPFENWIFRILGRLFLDLMRYRKRRVKTVSYDAPLPEERQDNVYFEKPDESTNPETLFIKETLSDELQEAINKLTPEQQTVVILADVEGLQYKEIAERIGAPVGTVRSRLHRSHKTLRKMLSKNVKMKRFLPAEQLSS
ncbi:MAG TPA: sigma-70 family RNA polymerase sigma factor [Fimbriimonadales bacterium]|nr:sigma-70 family RNA polymerase sigma factor [Fimbriimonadales bacterium]